MFCRTRASRDDGSAWCVEFVDFRQNVEAGGAWFGHYKGSGSRWEGGGSCESFNSRSDDFLVVAEWIAGDGLVVSVVGQLVTGFT